MFIKESVLKQIIKKSYKGSGLYIGRINGLFYIGGSSWKMAIDEETVGNKTKASIIELIGEFPGKGEAFKYTEGEIQQVINETLTDLNLDTYNETPGQTYHETKMYVNTPKGLGFYMQGDDLKKIIVSSEKYAMVNISAVDNELGEEPPQAPRLRDNHLIWGNNLMALEIFALQSPESQEEQMLFNAISKVDLCW